MDNLILKNEKIAVYNEFRAQLAELREQNNSLVFDYESPKGNRDARSHIYKLRQTKSALEKARKQEKQTSLEYGRRVDSEAKEIASELEKMIDVHATPLEEIEQREKDRIEKIQSRIQAIQSATVVDEFGNPLSSANIQTQLVEIRKISTDDSFAEFSDKALEAKIVAIELLENGFNIAKERETEAVELEQLRKEREERAQKEYQEKLRREGEERAKLEAEAKARAEKESSERRELQLKLDKEKAEREKVEAERRAELAAKEAEERLKREAEEAKKKEAEAAAKREANKKHKAKINNAAVAAFVKGGLTDEQGKLVVTLIASNAVPNVKISY